MHYNQAQVPTHHLYQGAQVYRRAPIRRDYVVVPPHTIPVLRARASVLGGI